MILSSCDILVVGSPNKPTNHPLRFRSCKMCCFAGCQMSWTRKRNTEQANENRWVSFLRVIFFCKKGVLEKFCLKSNHESVPIFFLLQLGDDFWFISIVCHKVRSFSKMIRRDSGVRDPNPFKFNRRNTSLKKNGFGYRLQMAKAETNSCFNSTKLPSLFSL